MAQYSKRGRPAGSSRLNSRDNLSLRKAAERITLNPTLRLTPALRDIGITDETAQRRLRRKWKAVATEYLAEAKAREAQLRYQQFMSGMRKIGDFLLQLGRVVEGAVMTLVDRYMAWADENPEQAENLKRFLLKLQPPQIEAKAQRA